jgi:hypothetical protein
MNPGRLFLYCLRVCVAVASLPPEDFVPDGMGSTAMSSSSTESYGQTEAIGYSTYTTSVCTRRDTVTFTPIVTANTLGACGVPDNNTGRQTPEPSHVLKSWKSDSLLRGVIGQTYACTSQDSCLYDSSWWGCCDDYHLGCPRFTTCVGRDQSCDAACKTNVSVLRW